LVAVSLGAAAQPAEKDYQEVPLEKAGVKLVRRPLLRQKAKMSE